MSQNVRWTESQLQEYLRRTMTGKLRNINFDAPKKRQPRGKVKTQAEAEYELIIKSEHPDARIMFQAYTLVLAPDCRYTPDYAVIEDNRVSFYEVKGRYVFEKALYKPRVAAAIFPHHKFFLAMKSDSGWSVRYLRSE